MKLLHILFAVARAWLRLAVMACLGVLICVATVFVFVLFMRGAEWVIGPTLLRYGPRVFEALTERVVIVGGACLLAWWAWRANRWRLKTVWGAVTARQPALATLLRSRDGRAKFFGVLRLSEAEVRRRGQTGTLFRG